jgi:hypothetical protein
VLRAQQRVAQHGGVRDHGYELVGRHVFPNPVEKRPVVDL